MAASEPDRISLLLGIYLFEDLSPARSSPYDPQHLFRLNQNIEPAA